MRTKHLNSRLFSFSAICVGTLAMQLPAAETLHYYRFEEGLGPLADSTGAAPLVATHPVKHVSLPDSGRGGRFPNSIPGIGSNRFGMESLGPISGFVAPDATPVDEAFTIELFANFDDLSHDGTVRRSVMSGQAVYPLDGTPENFGWAFNVEREGITDYRGQGVNVQNRELEMFASDGSEFYLIPSGILLEEGVDYYLSAAFDLNGNVRFYAVDLETDELHVANVSHPLTSLNPYPLFTVAWPFDWSLVDGIVDEVRFSRGVVPVDQLLVNVPEPSSAAIAVAGSLALAGVGYGRKRRCA